MGESSVKLFGYHSEANKTLISLSVLRLLYVSVVPLFFALFFFFFERSANSSSR
jgi:hypothetical protein